MFALPEEGAGSISVDGAFVQDRLAGIIDDEDLTRYIL
jgi:ATP-dependent protease HslVU (ClpYQ) ATPase subunit